MRGAGLSPGLLYQGPCTERGVLGGSPWAPAGSSSLTSPPSALLASSLPVPVLRGPVLALVVTSRVGAPLLELGDSSC